MPRRLRLARQRYVLDLDALNALITCPPPWEPIDPDTDEYLANLVAANLSALLDRHAARPGHPCWALVRYHADPDISRACIEAHARRLSEWIAAAGLGPWRDRHQAELEALETWAGETLR